MGDSMSWSAERPGSTGGHRRRRPHLALTLGATLVLVASVLAATTAAPAGGQTPGDEAGFSERGGVTVSGRVQGNKSPSSSLAESDPALLARRDAAAVPVVIKLDYDAVATYSGTLPGLAATSPAATGRALTGASAAETEYQGYIADQEAAVVAALQAQVPGAQVGRRLRTVYGGVAAVIPANAAKTVAAIPGVVAVQADELQQPLTDSSPDFVNAPPVYDELGTTAEAGAGVIYANLDTGIWPEHPSFADLGNLKPPGGPARECDFGDNPLTPANDPFVCNNKLIGGAAFLDSYLANPNNPPEKFTTARDSNGHGTHTASTTAGNIVEDVPVFGVDRGPIHGLAPGAHLMHYKVCGFEGCQPSDSAAAVGQAILDGVDVINFSISGGNNPFTDPVELAFLDAYAAGVFVSTSAGNEGPGAGTANHLSPWVTATAASTQTREFATQLNLTAANGDTFTADGASITAGAGPLPVVLAQNVPGYTGGAGCATRPTSPTVFDGLIVACQRGGEARQWKGFVVAQGGGEGMVLYNPSLADIETDSHWVPTVHLPDGTDFLAFMTSHTGVTGSFAPGDERDGQGDVMAAFSSRGPAGLFLKPDVTAPGVQILAGASPDPDPPSSVEGGNPPGQLYQAIAGTSMSSPHVAGAAVLLRAAHPDWSPGDIKSALMTTALTDVVKEDLVTPADPFDFGAGRIDIGAASAAPLTFSETPENFFALGNDPVNAVHLNIPSINAPVMPGRLVTTRVATNVTDERQRFSVSADAPRGSTITVTPRNLNLRPGQSATLTIIVESDAPIGSQQFGSIELDAAGAGGSMHLPVAFVHTQGSVTLTQACDPATIRQREVSTCTVEAANTSFDDQVVDVDTFTSRRLDIASVRGADLLGPRQVGLRDVTLEGASPGVPAVAPGPSPAGYLPLDQFPGTLAAPIGDEEIIDVNVPAFDFNGQSWTTIGVDSNGYVVAGETSSEDNECCTLPDGPDPARPNNMMAPLWSDLDGTEAQGILVNVLTDTATDNSWIVVEYRVNVFGTNNLQVFQVWIGLNSDPNPGQDISYAYDPTRLPTDPGLDFLVGAENVLGQGDMEAVLPTGDLRVTSSDAVPGDTVSYELDVTSNRVGGHVVTSEMTASRSPGTVVVDTPVTVVRRP
jgi:subtilisin family serine protease